MGYCFAVLKVRVEQDFKAVIHQKDLRNSPSHSVGHQQVRVPLLKHDDYSGTFLTINWENDCLRDAFHDHQAGIR